MAKVKDDLCHKTKVSARFQEEEAGGQFRSPPQDRTARSSVASVAS